MVKFRKEILVLLVLVLIGAYLRFFGLNWGLPYYLNGDEAQLVAATARLQTNWDPGFYHWGTLTLFMLGFFAKLASFFVNLSVKSLENVTFIFTLARSISATLGVLTIPLIFLVGRKLYNERVGLLAAALITFTVLLIQLSHFYMAEGSFVFFSLLAFYFIIDIYKKGDNRSYYLAAFFLAIAAAAKYTATLLLSVFLVAHLLRDKNYKSLLSKRVYLSAAIYIVTFLILTPYLIVNFQGFYKDLSFDSSIISGAHKISFTLPFEGSLPYIYHITDTLRWALGLPLELLALLGIAYAFRKRDPSDILLLTAALVYFLVIGAQFSKFIRYIAVILPFFVLLGSRVLTSLYENWTGYRQKFIAGLGAIVLLSSVFYSFAFLNIYAQPDSRVAAIDWINTNIPQSSVVASDSEMPFNPKWVKPENFQSRLIDFVYLYGEQNNSYLDAAPELFTPPRNLTINEKQLYFSKVIVEVDYIVLTDTYYDRYRGIQDSKYMPERQFFENLFLARSGFKQEKEFKSYPSLFGIVVNDSNSEASFRTFDHPAVYIFKKA